MPLPRVYHGPEVNRSAPVDWKATKLEIVAGLDVAAEYEALGVRWAGRNGHDHEIRPCYAVGRDASNPDDVPSAAVNVRTGFYWDKGGSQEKYPFLDFAAKYGRFGSWLEAAKHYAEKAGVEIGRVSRNGKGDILEQIYHYRDAEGKLRYGAFRYKMANGKKGFKQYPIRNGTWLKEKGCMEGVEPLPYRLPELLASDEDEPVLVVGGEKDVERAEELGMVATTNHGGEGACHSTWAVFGSLMPFRDYYLIPDNDNPGRDHVLAVAAVLYPLARSVRIVPLPGCTRGGDLSDWLDMGHDVEELGRLMHAAPLWTPGSPDPFVEAKVVDPDRPCRLATAADLILAGQTTEWIWEGWLAKGVLILLAAEANTGKTRFCMDLNKRFNLGLPLPDGTANPIPPGARCLWIAADGQHKELADNSIAYGFDPWSVVLNTDPEDLFGGTELSRSEHLATLEFNIRDVRPALVFIDTITNTSDHKSQDTVDAKRQYKPLMEIAQRTGTTIVCVTHLNAGGKVIGRRPNEKTRITISLNQPDPEDLRLRLQVTHTRYTLKPAPLGITMSSSGNTYDAYPPVAPDPDEGTGGPSKAPKGAKVKAAMAWLTEHLAHGPRRSKDVREAAAEAKIIPDSASAQTLYSALRKLGGIEEEIIGTYGKWFKMPEKAAEVRDLRNGDA